MVKSLEEMCVSVCLFHREFEDCFGQMVELVRLPVVMITNVTQLSLLLLILLRLLHFV